MKVGLLGSALLGKQLPCTLLLLNLVMKEWCYVWEMLRVGKALRSLGRHQARDSVTCIFLSLDCDFVKENKSVLGIAFRTWNIITNFLPDWSLHCIRQHNLLSYVCTVPSMRMNFVGGAWALQRQEVEQSVTNNETEMPAFERALLSLHQALYKAICLLEMAATHGALPQCNMCCKL